MSNQVRRPTKAEIEKRRWLIGTGIGVIGLILAAAAILPSQDNKPKPVYIAPPPASVTMPPPAPPAATPNKEKFIEFQQEIEKNNLLENKNSTEIQKPLRSNIDSAINNRKTYSIPLSDDEREKIISELTNQYKDETIVPVSGGILIESAKSAEHSIISGEVKTSLNTTIIASSMENLGAFRDKLRSMTDAELINKWRDLSRKGKR